MFHVAKHVPRCGKGVFTGFYVLEMSADCDFLARRLLKSLRVSSVQGGNATVMERASAGTHARGAI